MGNKSSLGSGDRSRTSVWNGLMASFMTLLLWLGLVLGLAGPSQADDSQLVAKAESARTTLADLPQAAQYTVSARFGRDDPAYHLDATTPTPQVNNPRQGLTASFNPAGLRVQAGDIDWNLTLTGWGRGEALTAPTADADPVRRANRVEYVHGDLTAWYVNGPLGLQQGWTVRERPAGEGDLTLTLRSQGLSAQVEANGRGLKLSDDHGVTRLHYGGLLAVDATGREMPVRFIVEGAQVRVAVNDAGATYPLIIDPWIQLAWLASSDGSDGSYNSLLGSSVAMSADGSIVVAGAPRPLFPAPASPGAVHVFVRPPEGWNNGLDASNETQLLFASDGVAGDEFGASVAISADGSTIVVGAPGRYPGGPAPAPGGAAYVFTGTGGWSQDAILTASDGEYGDLFGDSVAISAGGSTIVVGAPANNAGPYNASGAVYVFSGAGWPQVAKLENAPNGPLDGNLLGASVAVSADGNTIAAGKLGLYDGGYGSISVFVNPGTWNDATQDVSLTANDGAAGDLLGTSVAISADGNTIVAGAPKHASGAGAAYVFINPDPWVDASGFQDAKLTISGGYKELGRAVAISADSTTIVVGAPNEYIGTGGSTGLADGAAYVFVNSSGGWTEDARLTAFYGGNAHNQQLGRAVAIVDDGTDRYIAAGARFNDFGRGAVFIFGTPVPANVLSITRYSPSPTNADNVFWLVTFDRPVTGLTTGNFAIEEQGGVSGAGINYIFSNGGGADTVWWVNASTGSGNGTLRLDMTKSDGVTPTVSNLPFPGDFYTINKGAPTATVTAITLADGNPTGTASVSWNVTFSQSVAGLSTSNFMLAPGGGVSGASLTTVTGSGTTWTVTASTGSGNGTLGLNMVNDTNVIPDITNVPPTFVGQFYDIDKAAPTATVTAITRASGNPTSAASVDWIVTFSQSVTGLNTSNFTLVFSSGVSGASLTNVTGSGDTWTVTASTGAGNGTLRLDMLNSSGVNPPVTNVSFPGQVYTIDKTTPTVTAIIRASGNPTSLASVSWTVFFSQSVTGVGIGNFALVSGGSVSGASLTNVTGSGNTWTVTANTGAGDGTLRLDMTNSGGVTPTLTNLPFTGQVYTINKSVTAATVAAITRAGGNPTSLASVSWTVTFSQSVAGLNTSNFTLAPGGGVSGASLTTVTGSGDTWTVTANTGSGNGTLGLNLTTSTGVTPTLTNVPFTGQVYTIDKTTPTVTAITRISGDPTSLASVSWIVTFSQSVTGLSTSNFALVPSGGVSGASLTNVTGSGDTWTVTANTGTGNGTLGLNLTTSTGVTPTLTNVPFTGQVYTINKTTPTVQSITRASGNPTSLANVDWIVTFSQSVAGVGIGNFALVPSSGLSGTSLINVTGSGDTWTVTASTGSGTGTLRLDMLNSSGVNPTVTNVPFPGQVYTIAGPSSIFAVTWSGSQFVAVGSGGLIQTSSTGVDWTSRASGTTVDLYGVAWSGQLFVAVGDGGTLLTSADGILWTSRPSGTTQPLFGVAWSGGRFVAVGGEGTVLVSLDGIQWTAQPAGTANSLFGVSWAGFEFTMIGDNSTIFPLARPWGDDRLLPSNRWTMLGLPATPTAPGTVQSVFGASLPGAYGADWTVWRREATADQYVLLELTDPVAAGAGYWLRKTSAGAATLALDLTHPATPVTFSNPRCPSRAGCYEIALTPPAGGDALYNLVGMPFPYPVGWWEVRLEVDGIAYRLNAPDNRYVASTYWVWNGNGYDTYNSSTPGMVGLLQPWQGVWIQVNAASIGHAVKLLIPCIPKYAHVPPVLPAAAPSSGPSSEWARALDWLIAPAAAAPAAPAEQAWYVRLIVEEPTLGLRDRNSVLGQLADGVVGYDVHDLPELAPFGAPFLTVVFPHPDWGPRAGDYASDYRPDRDTPTGGRPAAVWRFELRADRAGYPARLRWEGPPDVLSRSELLDEDTGARYPADDPALLRDGVPATLTTPVRRFTWHYSGQPGP